MIEVSRASIDLLISIFLISACGDPIKEQALQQLPITEQRVAQLGEALTNGQVRNATLINQYAEKVSKLKPELIPLVNEFKKDAIIQHQEHFLLRHVVLDTKKPF